MHWTLKFQSGMTVADPSFARIVAAIENLQPDEAEGNGWVILETARAEGSLDFVQMACQELGIYIVEVRIEKSEKDFDQWKAGRKEPTGAVISQSKKSLFKTYENEHLSTEEVIAIAEDFFLNQKCHPDFQWRSIREDLEASA